jgi:hypothetical protein
VVEEQSAVPEPTLEAPAEEQQPEASVASTPEDIEAYWRKRQSNEARAHSEETRVLREQLARAQAQPSADGEPVDVAGYRQQVTDLQQALKDERIARITDVRKATYASAAEALADDALIAQMDEARLAALNARLNAEAESPPSRMDRNNPGRGVPMPPKRLSDMTSDELKQVLENTSPQWLAEVRGQQ